MKHVLITGGSDGLGKAAAWKLAQAGYSVTILSQNDARTKSAAEELGCGYVVADVTDFAAVDTAIARASSANGPIDILVNSAGIWLQDALDANDPDQIRCVMEVNALGTIYCTKAVVPAMKQLRGGRIISVISQGGLQAKAERAPYTASKWAVTGFMKSMQAELKSFNVAVDCFYPGAMNTGLFGKSGNSEGRDMSKALNPEIAAAALVYLCGLPDGVSAPELGIVSLGY